MSDMLPFLLTAPEATEANCHRCPHLCHPHPPSSFPHAHSHTLRHAQGCSPHRHGHSVRLQPASGDVPATTASAFDLSRPGLIGLCPSLWNQTLKVSRLFNMGWRPRAMEFAWAVNYLYYVWSVWFYTLPEAAGLWTWWYMEMGYKAAVRLNEKEKEIDEFELECCMLLHKYCSIATFL